MRDRAGLRRELLERFPWVARTDLGPQSVTAGECDRCGDEPRIVQPCGPPASGVQAATPEWALGRACALELGAAAWCEGHADEAEELLAVLAQLPPAADDVSRLWWFATGEVRLG